MDKTPPRHMDQFVLDQGLDDHLYSIFEALRKAGYTWAQIRAKMPQITAEAIEVMEDLEAENIEEEAQGG